VTPVLLWPNPMLRRPADLVDGITDEVRGVWDEMIEVMEAMPGVGLAAPQIGVHRRAFVIDVTGHRKARSCHGELVLFDPELVSAEEPAVGREGCLSVPDLTGDVARATRVVVRGFTPDGSERVLEADAFEARALLHELDHLDGFLFLDRVASAHSVFKRKVYR